MGSLMHTAAKILAEILSRPRLEFNSNRVHTAAFDYTAENINSKYKELLADDSDITQFNKPYLEIYK